jgi:hypothetical protein
VDLLRALAGVHRGASRAGGVAETGRGEEEAGAQWSSARLFWAADGGNVLGAALDEGDRPARLAAAQLLLQMARAPLAIPVPRCCGAPERCACCAGRPPPERRRSGSARAARGRCSGGTSRRRERSCGLHGGGRRRHASLQHTAHTMRGVLLGTAPEPGAARPQGA